MERDPGKLLNILCLNESRNGAKECHESSVEKTFSTKVTPEPNVAASTAAQLQQLP